MKRARVSYEGLIRAAIVLGEQQTLLFEDGSHASFDDVVWLPPLEPGTIFALGLNYADHAAELNFKKSDKPLIFLKGPNSFVGHRGTSPCPADVHQMHFECELAVIIGKAGRKIHRADAYEYVSGYTIANDYALREYLEGFYRPNLRVKNRDACTPVGPWLVDASDIKDPMNLEMRTKVNGELVQHGNTRDMIFGIPAIIEYLSEFMTLSPGDVLLTGTPKGIQFLKPGDEIVTEIDQIGSLMNTIVSESTMWSNEAPTKPDGITTTATFIETGQRR